MFRRQNNQDEHDLAVQASERAIERIFQNPSDDKLVKESILKFSQEIKEFSFLGFSYAVDYLLAGLSEHINSFAIETENGRQMPLKKQEEITLIIHDGIENLKFENKSDYEQKRDVLLELIRSHMQDQDAQEIKRIDPTEDPLIKQLRESQEIYAKIKARATSQSEIDMFNHVAEIEALQLMEDDARKRHKPK